MIRAPTGDPGSARRSFTVTMEWMALAICASASVLLLGWVMSRCRSGFDFTDEGYYLNWISNPWNYDASVTQFGFVYHPLYRLVGGDIVLLRQANVLITWGLSGSLCVVWVRSLCLNWTALRPSQRAGFTGVAIALASASLSFFDLWLPTPNYNSLAFQSLVVATIGALLADRNLSRISIVGWLLIGVGGAFAFLAKPTTAAILGCLIAGYAIAAGKLAFRGLLVSLATAILLLVISGLAIDGSLSNFVHRFIKGLDMANQLLPGSRSTNVLRWDGFAFSSRRQKVFFASILAIACGSAALSLVANKKARFGAALIAVLMTILVVAVIAGVRLPSVRYEPFEPMLFWAILLGSLPATIAFAGGIRRRVSRNSMALIVFLIILPYAYTLGTANNLWTVASRAALFWILAGLVVWVELAAAAGAWRKLLPMTAITLLVSTLILYPAMEDPYRQTKPLRAQINSVEVNPEKSRLFLTEEAASYVRGLGLLAKDNGFRSGDAMLDLTGVSPGALYVIGARPLGAAWILGGYPGSNDFLTMALRHETCSAIGLSWILTEPGANDALSPGLLQQFGIELFRDYMDVGSIKSTRSFAPTTFEQRLLKPTRTPEVARQACEKAKPADSSTPH